MIEIDKKLLYLIDLLIFNKRVSSIADFCDEISMRPQNITKIKNGNCHFTVEQIYNIIEKFAVNPNWVFSDDSNIFNGLRKK